VERIRAASVEQLCEVVPRPKAEAVWKHFQEKIGV
jgi:hypothetical protein